MKSPYLQSLLMGIAARAGEDAVALETIVEQTLAASVPAFEHFETSHSGDLYPFNRSELARFLRSSGLERWHQATWLTATKTGQVKSDTGLTVITNGRDADARLIQLVAQLWAQLSTSVTPTTVDGDQYIVMGQQHLVSLLSVARDMTHRNPDWTSLPLESSMRSSTANVDPRKSARPDGPAQRRRP